MSNLTDISDDDLRAEFARRQQVREQAMRERMALRRQRTIAVVTREMIDVLHPEHGRTGCSDGNTCNGWGSSRDNSSPRCTRCALLEVVDGYLPEEWQVYLDIRVDR